jgi:glycosyltransferase involved in cell wall biosynthesis
MREPPVLSICTPTRERPQLLRRALASVVNQAGPGLDRVELVVSDNSSDDASGSVAGEALAAWPGPTQYSRNRPPLDMVGNHNQCLSLAGGRNILFLHDDDLLLPDSLRGLLDVLEAPDAAPVNLFGVDVVRMDGSVRRRQRVHRDQRLSPVTALRHLLSDSSYVRLPGIVASAVAYREVGAFNQEAGNAIDLDMWLRLFSRYGLHTVPLQLAAYTVHGGALTAAMFTPETIGRLMAIFELAAALGVLPADEIRRLQRRWFHKFILAGTYRALEVRDRAAAAATMDLFRLPAMQQLGRSARWLPVRLAFTIATAAARRPLGATPHQEL